MSKTLQEFVIEQRIAIDTFEQFWLQNNRKNPEHYPLTMPTDNEGAWEEQFAMFDVTKFIPR